MKPALHAVIWATLLAALASRASAVGEGVIRRKGFQFLDKNCKEFMYSGWNSWELLEDSVYSPGEVDRLFDTMKNSGLTVGRFFGHGHDTNVFQLQYSAGSYNYGGLAGLDRLLDAAGKRGLKLVITLSDNWNEADGKKAYARWAGKYPHEFFTDAGIKQWFKNHIDFMTNRVNSINGKIYKYDDAIFSWNLMNEPRCACNLNNYNHLCDTGCADNIQTWIEEMSAYLKSQDPNHLVTVGEEGFYSQQSGRGWVNPHHRWAQHTGQDFIRNHSPSAIDYAAIHVWPDNWQVANLGFQQRWVNEHISDSYGLGKPFVVEEFGKVAQDDEGSRSSVRNPHFRNIYDTFSSQRSSGGPMKGVAFWEFGSSRSSSMSVYQHHSTWKDIILPHSTSLQSELQSKPSVSGCRAGASRSFDIYLSGGTTFLTAGPQLIAGSQGNNLSGEMYASLQGCAEQCTYRSDCTSFAYLHDRGVCTLWAAETHNLAWSMDGWQTYWREMGVDIMGVLG